MDPKEFVSKTLSQIIDGIKEVQANQLGENESESGGQRIGQVNPPISGPRQGMITRSGEQVEFVEFDMAVTAEETASAGAGVKVIGFSVGGDLGEKSGTVSRVKFRVPVEWPRG
jgi:hypothetical protein